MSDPSQPPGDAEDRAREMLEKEREAQDEAPQERHRNDDETMREATGVQQPHETA